MDNKKSEIYNPPEYIDEIGLDEQLLIVNEDGELVMIVNREKDT